MLVSICVATYQRLEGLQRLLDGLNQLTFRKIARPDIEVVVVDNDANGCANAVYTTQVSHFQWSLKYCVESIQGISYARNQAIASLNPNTNFVAFIDDDEVPNPSWLDELLSVQQIYDADVVTGPVLPHFIQSDVPDWVVKGKFFEPQRFPTGHLMKVAFTNNVLIRFEVLQKLGTIFDERFARSGGEDVHFFMRVYRAGYKIVWADEALVYEWIPESRMQVKWILERGFLGWSRHSFCERELYPSFFVLATRIVKGIGLMTQGICLIFPSLFLGQHRLIKALLNIYRGVGTLAGLCGVRYEVYKAVPCSL
ncbi:glycosyl transferase family 2 [Scytonema hofmannii PCC 7110]|uniref:Glycosyl transferase family 2 n=1 Tax=Scytonema hofmannii PCC 7110 TaxID=128403 RepID=A0A139WTZ4_9CYAN|nr:glycosyltransferase [Scytonema hofmannii]KYC35901.1 glycosyl transferase family 2 [Scytonema hofmannii PCC 7110]